MSPLVVTARSQYPSAPMASNFHQRFSLARRFATQPIRLEFGQLGLHGRSAINGEAGTCTIPWLPESVRAATCKYATCL